MRPNPYAANRRSGYTSSSLSAARTTGDRYLEERVATATPAELVALLYDGFLRNVRQAVELFEQQKFYDAGPLLIKAQAILVEFRTTLNHEEGGEIAANLDRLYEYAHRRLLHANLRRDVAAAEEAIRLIEPIRDAWAESCLGRVPQPAAAG